MALSTEFTTPGPQFDPTKYGRKSAARSSKTTVPALISKAVTATVGFQRSKDASKLPQGPSSPINNTNEAEMTKSLESTCTIVDDDTTSSHKATNTEETRPAPTSGLKTKQHNSDLKRTELIQKDEWPYPATLIAAEYFDLTSIPAPDATPEQSTDTRRLVSLRCIQNIHSAKVGSRWLTLAQADQWTCTVPRHAFGEGELVVYIEIDSFLPIANGRFGRMSSLQTFNGELGHRVKTRRFGSYPDILTVQGYIYPLEKFDEVFDEIKCIRQALNNVPSEKPNEEQTRKVIRAMYRNEDWAARIGVKKWEEPNPVNMLDQHPRLGTIPTRVFKKTDITHFEDCPNIFTKAKYFTNEYQESVKMDGASMTVYFVKTMAKKFHDLNDLPAEVGSNMVLHNGRFGVASKTVDLNELSRCCFGYWRTALKNDLPAKLSKLDRSIAVQGELCGPGINQNREKLRETEFFVYSMWDIALQKYIDPRKVEALAEKLGLKHVPVLRYIRIREIASNHDELRNLADKRPGEGLVYKCVRDGRSFKVHSPAYKVLHNC